MARRYAVLDVFTGNALEGNPLAVVLDAQGLDDGAMQRIAREFALSETVFVLPAEKPAHSARLRIFTPARELPFAGHPTVGTAALLAAERFGAVEREMEALVVLEEQIGDVRAVVRVTPKGPHYAEFDLPRLARPFEARLGDKAAIALALGLRPNDIGFENHLPTIWQAGNPFAFVPLAGLDAMRRVAPDTSVWAEAFGTHAHNDAFVYCRETLFHDSSFHARMFAPTMGIAEDPATGSAVAAFTGVIHKFDAPTAGTHRYRIEQGFEMGRPSLIDLELQIDGGQVTAGRIGGQVVKVAEGVLLV